MAEIKDKGKVARVPVFQTPPKAQYQRQNKKERFVQNLFVLILSIFINPKIVGLHYLVFFFFYFKKKIVINFLCALMSPIKTAQNANRTTCVITYSDQLIEHLRGSL